MNHRYAIRALVLALSIALSMAMALPSAFAQPRDEPSKEQGDVRVTKPPRLVHEVKAQYTEEAVEKRIEGPVQLRLTISATGEVTEVEVLEGLGHGLDQAAVEAARQFVFEPAEINNQPAAVVLTFTINFSLPTLPASLEGRVVDAETGDPVEATVEIEYIGDATDEELSASMTTQKDGTFGFEEVLPGPYRIRLRVEGYDDYESTIELAGGEAAEVTYRVAASPINLTGQVREAGTRKPLSAVRVTLWPPEANEPLRETYSGPGGRFDFRGVAPGRYSVRMEADGYFTTARGVEVVSGEVTEGTFFLRAEYYDEYVVETVEERDETEVSRRRLELEEIRRIPGTGGDVVRVVQNLPGVARAPFTSGLIVVRGSAPQDTKVFLDGDNIPLVYHFLGGPAVINSEMIDSLEFFPGNFSTYYGRATGGVIDLSTRRPRDDRYHGMIEVDLLDATAMVEGPIGEDFSIALSGRRSYFDVFLPLILPDDGPDIYVAPRYYDYQGWLTYRGFDDHIVELVVYGSDDRLELLLPPDEPAGNEEVQITGINFTNSFIRGQLKWQWRPALPVENTLMVSYGLNSIAFDAAENLFFDARLYLTQIRDDMRLKFNEHVTVRMGLDNQLGSARTEFRTPGFSNREDDVDGNGEGRPNFDPAGLEYEAVSPQMFPAFYLEPEVRPIERLLLVPGLRVDYFGPIARTSVSPRFSFRWDVTDGVTAKGGVGLFTQPPLAGAEDPELGNPDLTFEKAVQYAVGAEWQPREYLGFDVTLFYRDMFDLLSQTSDFEVGDDGRIDPVLWRNEGEGRAYGAEFLIRHYPQNRFFGWVAYTLSRSERLNLTTREFDVYQYDQTHILTLVGGYNLPRNWDVSTRFRLVTGAPYTPIVGGVYNSDSDDYERVFGPRNSARNPAFHQLDLRVDKKFVFDTWLLGFYLDIQNIYNRKNVEGYRYNYDFSDREPVRGLPFLPTVGVMGQF